MGALLLIVATPCLAEGVASATPVISRSDGDIRVQNQDSIIHIKVIKRHKDGVGADSTTYGTGFIISDRGFVLTASHVIERDDRDTTVEIYGAKRSPTNPHFPMQLIKRDDDVDLALLEFPENGEVWKPVSMGNSSSVPLDARLLTYGFPGGQLELSPASGQLSNRFGPRGRWQTTLPINRGNSGGPVFDLAGKVVAIAWGGNDEMQAVTFVVPEAFSRGLRLNADVLVAMADLGAKPVHLAGGVSQEFSYYLSAPAGTQKIVTEQACLPAGFDVTKWSIKNVGTYGDGTRIRSIKPDTANMNCLEVEGFVASNHLQKIGPIDVGGGEPGWLRIVVTVDGQELKNPIVVPAPPPR